jgi:hypothetical protein
MWVVPDLQLSYDRSDAPSDKLHSAALRSGHILPSLPLQYCHRWAQALTSRPHRSRASALSSWAVPSKAPAISREPSFHRTLLGRFERRIPLALKTIAAFFLDLFDDSSFGALARAVRSDCSKLSKTCSGK